MVAAPVAEEMFFRGFLQGRLRQGFGPVLAIGLTTIAFSLVHYSGNLLHPLGVAVMSIGCGVLRERTGSLWPAILLHAVNNSSSSSRSSCAADPCGPARTALTRA